MDNQEKKSPVILVCGIICLVCGVCLLFLNREDKSLGIINVCLGVIFMSVYSSKNKKKN